MLGQNYFDFIKYFNNYTCGFSKASTMQIKWFWGFFFGQLSDSDLLIYLVYSC